jgi:hypothetical protein
MLLAVGVEVTEVVEVLVVVVDASGGGGVWRTPETVLECFRHCGNSGAERNPDVPASC